MDHFPFKTPSFRAFNFYKIKCHFLKTCIPKHIPKLSDHNSDKSEGGMLHIMQLTTHLLEAEQSFLWIAVVTLWLLLSLQSYILI